MTELRLRADKLQWLETDGQVIALDERELVYLSANQSGAVLWEELARGTTRERLVERLVQGFGIDAEAAGADVDDFVAALDAQGLLEATAPVDPGFAAD